MAALRQLLETTRDGHVAPGRVKMDDGYASADALPVVRLGKFLSGTSI